MLNFGNLHNGLLKFGLGAGNQSLQQQALAILRKYGTKAHAWIPGVGTVAGLNTGNYIETTTRASAVDEQVGLVLDACGSVGSELVVNGTFDTDSGWTKIAASITGGKAVFDGTTVVNNATPIIQSEVNLSFVIGRSYILTYTVTISDSNYISINIAGINSTARNISGTYTEYITANNASQKLLVTGRVANTTHAGSIDNISVREVTGIHPANTLSAACPKLRRGAVNLLKQSHTITSVTWTKVVTATTPDNTTILLPAVNDALRQEQLLSAPSAFPLTVAAVLSGSGTVTLAQRAASGTYAFFGKSVITLTSTPTLYVSSANTPEAITRHNVYILRDTGNTATSVTFGGAALFQGTFTAAQIAALGGIPVTTTAAKSTNKGNYYWEFDGSDDCWQTGVMDLSYTDKATVIAGVTKLSDAATGFVFELSALAGVNPGTFQLRAPSASFDYFFANGGTGSSSTAISSTYPAPITKVLTGVGDISGDLSQLQVNGTVAATSTADQGTGNYGSMYPLNIGSRNKTGSFFKGNLHPTIIIGAKLPDNEIKILEKFVAKLTGPFGLTI